MAIFHRPLPRTLEAALRDLDEPSATVRRSAIRDLARHARQEITQPIASALLKALRDDDPIVRTEAAYTLGDGEVDEALPGLLMTIDDRHPGVRQAAIDALGRIGDARATGRLTRALDDERPDVRFQAVIALARVSPTHGVDAVVRAGRDEDFHVRYIAVRVAEEICSGQSSGDPPPLADSPLVLPEAIREAATDWIEDDDIQVQLAAAILLGRGGDTRAADLIVDAVFGRIPSLEPEDEAAAVALAGALGLDEAIPALERRAFGFRRFVRESHAYEARIALARMGHDRAIRHILGELSAWSRNRRTMAVTAAGRAALEQAREPIERMRGEEQLADQEAVTEALTLLAGART